MWSAARYGVDFESDPAGAMKTARERVATLVRHVSEEDKSLPWEERKKRYLEHFTKKPWEAQAITLADKIDNFASIIECADRFGNPWAMFKRGKAAQETESAVSKSAHGRLFFRALL